MFDVFLSFLLVIQSIAHGCILFCLFAPNDKRMYEAWLKLLAENALVIIVLFVLLAAHDSHRV